MAAIAGSQPAPYLSADFEAPNALDGWRVERSPESGAVDGGLALGPGHRQQGAVLRYRLPCERGSECDASVTALWRPASNLPKKRRVALSLWIRHSPDVEVSLVVGDSGNRLLWFPMGATIEYPKPGDWQYVAIALPEERITEIGIRVQALFRTTVQGELSFDEIRLQETPESFFVDAAAKADPPSPDPPDLAARLGVNIHLLRDDHSLDLAQAAGFKFVRMDMEWKNVERRGRYRFFPYDALLRALDARGMWALWILDYGHPDHGGGVPRTPEDIAAFARFAGAAAEHFKGRNVRFEIWNEPDNVQFWVPGPNAAEYAALLRAAVAAIQAADPAAKVSSGGVSRMDLPFLSRVLDPNLAASLTALGIHPYPKNGPETIAPALGVLSDWAARALGQRVEIWDTEWGYSSAIALRDGPANGHGEEGRRRQAALAARELLTVWALGLPLAVWYDLRDDGPDAANPEQNYGLIDSGGEEKPALQAVRNLIATMANGRKYAGMVSQAPAEMHAMRLEGAADTVMIVWTDQAEGRRNVEFPKMGMLSATDLFGVALKGKDKSGGRVRVEINSGSGPIYLVWKRLGSS